VKEKRLAESFALKMKRKIEENNEKEALASKLKSQLSGNAMNSFASKWLTDKTAEFDTSKDSEEPGLVGDFDHELERLEIGGYMEDAGVSKRRMEHAAWLEAEKTRISTEKFNEQDEDDALDGHEKYRLNSPEREAGYLSDSYDSPSSPTPLLSGPRNPLDFDGADQVLNP